MNREDITLEFYSRKAKYISPITTHTTYIDIKQVFNVYVDSLCMTMVLSTNGVEYPKEQLAFFV